MNEETNNKQEQTQQETSKQDAILQELKECQAQKDEWKDRFLRTAADFENYKKRSEKERVMWITNAQSSVLQDLIEIVDDFDRAFAPSLHLSGSSDSASSGGQATQSNEVVDQSRAGFELIYKALKKLLEKYGVTEMKTIEHFDPTMHEAIMQVETPDHKPGDIVQVLQKGYLFKGNVLRPAKVSVCP